MLFKFMFISLGLAFNMIRYVGDYISI